MDKDKKDNHYYKGRYRIPSARLKNWDYLRKSSYFITICTKNMIPAFGCVTKNKMELNKLGLYVDQSIEGIKIHKKNINIINHIVMPNHVHILLFLNNPHQPKIINRFGPLIPESLSALINHFKGRITKYAQKEKLFWPDWQDRFHDKIIKDKKSFDFINQYISNNPLTWKDDRYFRK